MKLTEKADAALCLWDLLVTECESEELLCKSIADSLQEMGLAEAESKKAAIMANEAFARSGKYNHNTKKPSFPEDTLFLEMLDQLQSNGWEI